MDRSIYIDRGRGLTITNQTIFALLATVMFCQSTFFEYFRIILARFPGGSILSAAFFPLVYAALFMLSYNNERMHKIKVPDAGILLFFALAIAVTYIIYPQNFTFISENFTTDILPIIPFFLLGLCLTFDDETLNMIGIFSCFAIIVSTLYVFYFTGQGNSLSGTHGESYSMHWSYLLLPNILIVMEAAFRRKKLFYIICMVVGIIYAVAMGSRGPIVIIAAFLMICIWTFFQISTGRKLFILALLAGLVIWFVSSDAYVKLLEVSKDFLNDIGVSSRIIDFLMEGEMVSNTSGRDTIYADLISKLWESPLWGYGVYGEYPLGYEAGAHNVYLQLMFHFGIPVGLLLLAAFVILYVKGLLAARGTLRQRWILLFGCIVFVRAIFGGNYFDFCTFFLLGLLISAIREADEMGSTALVISGGK